jgi:DNA-binding transcriptional ArsR family regulator
MRRHAAIPLFRLFGVPQRVVIFQRLARCPQTASELAKELPISRSAVVQHLTALREHGLVEPRSEGRKRVYRTTPVALAPLAEWLTRHGAP